MTRRFRSDHDHVQIGTRHDLVVVNGEAVSEGQGRALLQVRLDLLLVQAALKLVGGQDHYQIGSGNGGWNVTDLQAMGLGLGNGRGTRTQTDGDVDAGILQVARVRVALGTVTDDGDLLALDDGEVAVFIVRNLHELPLLPASWAIR